MFDRPLAMAVVGQIDEAGNHQEPLCRNPKRGGA